MVNRAFMNPAFQGSNRRFRILANSALCSAAVVGAVMQISVAVAGNYNLTGNFDNTANTVAVPPVPGPTAAETDNLIVNMKDDQDSLRLGTVGTPFVATFSGTATVDGGANGAAGGDTLILGGASILTVTGNTTFDDLENVRTAGTINANGGLDHNGTAGDDVIAYTGGGTINVTGALNINTGATTIGV